MTHSLSAMMCYISALTILMSSAVCPTWHKFKLCVPELARKCKGLLSFLSLHCKNSECSTAIISSQIEACHARQTYQPKMEQSLHNNFAINLRQ